MMVHRLDLQEEVILTALLRDPVSSFEEAAGAGKKHGCTHSDVATATTITFSSPQLSFSIFGGFGIVVVIYAFEQHCVGPSLTITS